jgi:two-component system response regulator YesN
LVVYLTIIAKKISVSIRQKDSQNTINQIIDYIHMNFTKPLTLNTLAEKFYMNPHYLGQLIKKHLCVSFNQYLHSLRIDHAKHLLQTDEVKVNDLASSLGYSDSQYFSKVFKKFTGISPSDYKQTTRE